MSSIHGRHCPGFADSPLYSTTLLYFCHFISVRPIDRLIFHSSSLLLAPILPVLFNLEEHFLSQYASVCPQQIPRCSNGNGVSHTHILLERQFSGKTCLNSPLTTLVTGRMSVQPGHNIKQQDLKNN